MRFYAAISLLLCSSGVLSAPTAVVEKGLIARGGKIDIAAEIIQVSVDLAKSILDLVDDINDKQHDAEEKYTKGMVAQMQRLHPDKNVVVFHDQDSDISGLLNPVHEHYELPLPDSAGLATKGYEIILFDSGSFHRAGDGGYINWCIGGLFTMSDSSSADFSQPLSPQDTTPPPASPPVPPTQPTRKDSSNNDGNYFVNCENKATGVTSSGLAYYANLNPGQNIGQQPTDYQDVHHDGYYTWEQPGQVTFGSTGTKVHWSIFGNAQDGEVNSAAGGADNGYENFWVYKDAGNYLYSVGDWDCSSIYWAF